MPVLADDLSDALARIVLPLEGDAPDELVDLVAGSRVVLLGEATHGTHEFYAMRAHVTRSLLEHHGFSAVAIEGDWPDALRVDRYVRGLGDDESAEQALAGFQRFPTWMWRNTDVAALVEWMRGHGGAGFYGLDLYSLHASIRAVLSYLEDVDPDGARLARERYACFDHAPDPQQYGLHAHFGLGDSCEEEVVAQLVEQQRRHAARSGRTPSGEAWWNAMVNANVVRNAEAYYRTMFSGRTESWNLRDTHMADTVGLVLEHLEGAARSKLVVWAHDSHVGDARATELGESGQLSLGQLLRERYPDEVALVGFTTHQGTVRCAHDWDEPPHRERVRESLPESWEELFHGTGVPRFLVTSGALGRVLGEEAERLHRAIGVVYRPDTERQSHYYYARLAEQYDVIVHVDETTAVEPLDREEALTQPYGDAPETYPTGM